MKAAVIVFPASNCDRDVKVALERTEGVEPVMVWHKETEIPKVDLIVLPGGFAFGDYLRCGAIAAHSPVMYEIRQRADKGVPILGICNGFQVLTEAGLLPGALLRNAGIKFLAKDVYYISELPSDVQRADVITIGLVSLVLSFVATLYPSWRASRVNPAEALRYE